MKELKRFKIGSQYFFDKFDDYETKDNDILIIMDKWVIKKTNILNLKDKEKNDVFFCKNMSKDEFIKYTLKENIPMQCGKFLIKEFNEYLGITIDDLKLLEDLIYNMDDRHIYEIYIYECYLNNNKFELTEEQLLNAYDIYKSTKNKYIN